MLQKKRFRVAACLLSLWLGVFVCASCEKSDKASELEWTRQEQLVFFGIPATVHFAQGADAKTKPADVLKHIDDIYQKINHNFNAFKESSVISGINKAKENTSIPISAQMAEAFLLSRLVSEKSLGAFDPTIWPYKELWSKAKETKTPPDSNALISAAECVGLDNFQVSDNGKSLTKTKSCASFDPGGMIKGYTVDLIARYLKENGVRHALVQCGGEIRVWGRNPEGRPWRLGVQDPLDMQTIFASIEAPEEIALSTSGNYRQPVIIGDTTYYHIFDPRSGAPVSTRVLGVTVSIAAGDFKNARADAWATALTVLGPTRGLELAEAYRVEALFIMKSDKDESIETLATAGLRGRLTLMR